MARQDGKNGQTNGGAAALPFPMPPASADLRSDHPAQRSASNSLAGSGEAAHPALIALVRLLARQAVAADLAVERVAQKPED